MHHQLRFAFIYRQSWPLLRPAWKGKEVEVKIVQITIQQISGNPARPQSMQPNIYQVKIFEESWRFFGEVFDLVRASRCNQFAINKFVAREHLNEKLSHLSNKLF